MSAIVDTRKRSREEEQNEFMPLSKRINNLHLNNPAGGGLGEHGGPAVVGYPPPPPPYSGPTNHHMPLLGGPAQLHHHHPAAEANISNGGYNNNNNININNNNNSSSNPSSCGSSGGSLSIPASGSNSPASYVSGASVNGDILGDYCPDLTAEENPHYFDKNKMLYELYVERMLRVH